MVSVDTSVFSVGGETLCAVPTAWRKTPSSHWRPFSREVSFGCQANNGSRRRATNKGAKANWPSRLEQYLVGCSRPRSSRVPLASNPRPLPITDTSFAFFRVAVSRQIAWQRFPALFMPKADRWLNKRDVAVRCLLKKENAAITKLATKEPSKE